jgi:carbon-monoxide dehydrogenase large subunit
MNDAVTLPPLKFGIGQPVHRKEDPRLVRGEGRYADDISLPGQASARVVRSAHGHGLLRGVDVAAALALPGVLAVYTAADFARAGYGTIRCTLPLKNADGSPLFAPPRPIFATDRCATSASRWPWWWPRMRRSQRTPRSWSSRTSSRWPR